ncbi:MAG: hypothetical protein ACYDBP_12050 [Leptospirales bacterium]
MEDSRNKHLASLVLCSGKWLFGNTILPEKGRDAYLFFVRYQFRVWFRFLPTKNSEEPESQASHHELV